MYLSDPETLPSTISPEDFNKTLWDTRIVHAVPGRVRLSVPALKAAPNLAGSFEALLAAQPGVNGAVVNSWCHSVTVNCDSMYWTGDTLCAFLQQLGYGEIGQYEPVRPPLNNDASWMTLWLTPATCWKVAGCATLMLGIVLFALPMIPGGTPMLLLSGLCFTRAAALNLGSAVAI
jgi:hypothetical protein